MDGIVCVPQTNLLFHCPQWCPRIFDGSRAEARIRANKNADVLSHFCHKSQYIAKYRVMLRQPSPGDIDPKDPSRARVGHTNGHAFTMNMCIDLDAYLDDVSAFGQHKIDHAVPPAPRRGNRESILTHPNTLLNRPQVYPRETMTYTKYMLETHTWRH